MTTGAIYEYIGKLEDLVGTMVDELIELERYMDNRADADFQGDPGEYVPNEEMRFLSSIRDILEKEKAIKSPVR